LFFVILVLPSSSVNRSYVQKQGKSMTEIWHNGTSYHTIVWFNSESIYP